MIVSKFGGSSVKDAASMWKCVDVVEATGKSGLVIISATYNTTNDLEKIYEVLANGNSAEAKTLWEKVYSRHVQIAKDLNVYESEGVEEYLSNLNTAFGAILVSSSLPPETRDKVLSFGERLSSWLFFHGLKQRLGHKREIEFLFAPDIISTDSNFGLAKPDFDKIKYNSQKLSEFIKSGGLYVTQGFLGADPDGRITTLGREGSDYSATLFGGALGADEVHIWTDVAGIYSVDPNVVPDPVRLEELSFDDASVLAKAGAKVLFPKTLEPLRGLAIPVKVGKTKDPDAGCTWVKEVTDRTYPLLGITFKERGNGLVITLVGNMVYDLDMEVSEIDRGDNFRSFFVNSSDKDETLNLWYRKYFC